MKNIYNADNVIDANLIKGLLEAEGIRAFVNGELLTGGIGELPASGLVTVSVADDDVEAATTIVKDYIARNKQGDGRGETRWDPSGRLLDW